MLTIEEVGGVMNSTCTRTTSPPVKCKKDVANAEPAVPVNLKDRDAFHLTIEEYLLSLVSLIEELVRFPPPPSPSPSTALSNAPRRRAWPATP